MTRNDWPGGTRLIRKPKGPRWEQEWYDEIGARKIIDIINDQFQHEGDIAPETNLIHDLGADSLDVVELVMGVEDQFEIELPMSFTPIRVMDLIKAVKEATDGD